MKLTSFKSEVEYEIKKNQSEKTAIIEMKYIQPLNFDCSCINKYAEAHSLFNNMHNFVLYNIQKKTFNLSRT